MDSGYSSPQPQSKRHGQTPAVSARYETQPLGFYGLRFGDFQANEGDVSEPLFCFSLCAAA